MLKKLLVLSGLFVSLSLRADDGTIDLKIDPATGVMISAPGSYRLVSNVTLSTTDAMAIVINANDVILDFGGHTISASEGAGAIGVGIQSVSGNTGLQIRNGAIKGFPQNAIACTGGAIVQDMRFEGNNKAGTLFVVTVGTSSIVERCVLVNNSAIGSTTGINVGAGSRVVGNIVENNDSSASLVTGIRALSGSCEIIDNIVRDNTAATPAGLFSVGIDANSTRNLIRGNTVANNDNTGTGGAIGIRAGEGNIIEGNIASDQTAGSTATADCFGILAGSQCLVSDNACSGNAGGGGVGSDSAGISSGAGSRIVGNTCSANNAVAGNISRGILSTGSNCLIADNVCAANIASGTGAKARGIEVSGAQCRVEANTCSDNQGSGAGVAEAIGIVVTGDGGLIIRNNTNDHDTATLTGGIRLESTASLNRVQENLTHENGFDIQDIGGNSIPAAANHLENIAY